MTSRVRELQEVWVKEYGVALTDAEASILAEQLLSFFGLLARYEEDGSLTHNS